MTAPRPSLTAVALVCSLKRSPAQSSSELIAEHVCAQLRTRGVKTESLRCADYAISPGVEADMGEGDEWPRIREKLLECDILVLATPVWLGHPSSVAQRVLERLDAELSNTDDAERPVMVGKVALVAVVGNEDGAHKVVADCFQGLNDIGYTIPAQGCTYWNGEAMQSGDYKDLDEVPEAVASTTAAAARNAAHLATVLRERQYPPYQ
ncbi:flavodoxin [Mycolicibacterium moriokaense]|jgi:multimeric flavodoxin WrbA|uniref:Flavodoxin n=1 Tax=Mycolicibacterium moriokaense TaxID=39691 RepID=A0AAD1M7S5_9MYCO|nr:NAD(P)H-dependent oxidoreductase [Mycolicibacterium moriokaense]MCV7037261.1 NAD(P)H-dependent oxidoreductase [Mycolicibacterium moriokaense]ORB20999.1 flavodoxin [Mycolicibacterium moriokaense]BBX04217.1 flavodoxin [Mycolicibacterium moriokaense]